MSPQVRVRQAARFAVVGAAATSTHVSVAVLAVERLSTPVLLANALAFAAALLVSYFGNHAWTFRRSGRHNKHFPRFLLIALAGLAANQAIMFAIVNLAGLNYLFGLALVVLIVPASSFVMSRRWAFTELALAAGTVSNCLPNCRTDVLMAKTIREVRLPESLVSAEGRRAGVALGRGQRVILGVVLMASALLLVNNAVGNWPVRPPTWVTADGFWTGRDFVAFWAASDLALHGQPAQAYDFARIHDVEVAVVGGEVGIMAWVYPPPALLLVLPLALLPYPVALALWLVLPLAGLTLLLWRLAPHPLTPWVAPLFTGVGQCLAVGQNGVIAALLLGAGLLALDRRPLLAGCCFGLLACKPQLVVLVGPALLVGGYYRALMATATAMLALALASWIAFGTAAWQAFLDTLPHVPGWLEGGSAHWYALMATVFGAARLAGASAASAYTLQWLSTIGALAVVVWIWRRPLPLSLRGSALAAAIPMATPYGFSYDLVLLGLPLAWLAWDGLTRGWRRGDFAVLVLVWIAPFLGSTLARYTSVLLTPLVLMLLLAVVCRRAMEPPRAQAAASDATA